MNNARSQIEEYEDTWILRPMRGACVVRTLWHPEHVELETDTPFRIVVGHGAEAARGAVAEQTPSRHSIGHWTRDDGHRMVSAPILSPVFFKSGSLRIAFGNGWALLVSARHREVPATVFFGNILMWDRSGLADSAEFSVVAVDRWTGRRVDAPPWPSRPSDIDTDSDDING